MNVFLGGAITTHRNGVGFTALKSAFLSLPSRLADAPSVAILDPALTVQERGFA
jgi:hypothetical protein